MSRGSEYLLPALIRRAKHAAVNQRASLSRLVQAALASYLDHLGAVVQIDEQNRELYT